MLEKSPRTTTLRLWHHRVVVLNVPQAQISCHCYDVTSSFCFANVSPLRYGPRLPLTSAKLALQDQITTVNFDSGCCVFNVTWWTSFFFLFYWSYSKGVNTCFLFLTIRESCARVGMHYYCFRDECTWNNETWKVHVCVVEKYHT